MGREPGREWFVAVQVNASSLIDEGVEPVLDRLRDSAGANAVMLTVHGFNPEVIDRPEQYSGHGEAGPHRSAGGLFATPHPEYYRDLPLGEFRVRESLFDGFDILTETMPAARARGMGVYLYLLESASTGGRQWNLTGFPRLLEIDVLGRRGTLPCINHPTYRGWKLALIEDLYQSYEFDGFLWGVERWGPLHRVLVGDTPACFCPHCRTVAHQAGFDLSRAREGYRVLWEADRRWRSSAPGARSPFVEFLRILVAHPEILGWERLWTDRYLALHREVYGVAKWFAPARPFGLGLWHYYFISPLLRAEWNLADFAASADFIRPILYHLPEGPRIRRYLTTLGKGAVGHVDPEQLLGLFSRVLDVDLPPLEEISQTGLPAEYVAQGVRIVRREAGPEVPIYAGIGLDVREPGFNRAMQPSDVIDAVRAAARAGADGITVSRNYAEMQLENLRAVGEAIRSHLGESPPAR
jgi:hypothetical protein